VDARSEDLSRALPLPGSCPAIRLVGDSHSRVAFDLLRDHGFNVTYTNANGVQDHWIDGSALAERAKHGDCAGQAFKRGNGPASLLHSVAAFQDSLPGHTAHDVVVLGAGTWDLRDMSVDDFVRDVKVLFGRVEALKGRARFVFRNAPAYSYKRGGFLGSREMRTNEKLAEAAARVRELLPPHMGLWDSFAVTAPRFEESCDTHHFICHGQSVDEIGIGVADLSAFLLSVCEPGGGMAPVEMSRLKSRTPGDEA